MYKRRILFFCLRFAPEPDDSIQNRLCCVDEITLLVCWILLFVLGSVHYDPTLVEGNSRGGGGFQFNRHNLLMTLLRISGRLEGRQ